jgi:heme/copper-type cytochrome/quinol oxidase subunit 4
MRTLSAIHPILRILGVCGLFLTLLNNSTVFESPFIATKYTPYIVILSVILISLGLYLKLKYAEEEPSTITYISTVITLLVALAIGGLLLISVFPF